MAEQGLKESLSALIDGQASEIEMHRLLRDAYDHPSLLRNWGLYRKIGDVIRGSDSGSISMHVDLSERIRRAIAEEPVIEGRQAPRMPALRIPLKAFGGAMIAAAVALVAVLAFRGNDPATEPVSSLAGASGQPQPVAEQSASDRSLAEASGSRAALDPAIESELSELPPEKQKRLREYLLRMDRRMAEEAQVVNYPNKR